MTELTAEKRAELRERAECRKVDGAQWVEVGPSVVLSLLDALDAADAKLATIGDAWSRYQRNDLSQEEFEGTVAERVE